MNQEQKIKLNFIIDAYGTMNQKDVAIEECSELIKALIKDRRVADEGTRLNVIEEIADVEIMIEQLKLIYNCREAVSKEVDNKLDRTIERARLMKC